MGRSQSLCLTVCLLLGLPTVVKLVDRDTLLKEKEEKKRVSKVKVMELEFAENENTVTLVGFYVALRMDV